MTDYPAILNVLHLLSELSNARLSLEEYEACFLHGLTPIFGNEFAILLLLDDRDETKATRKIAILGKDGCCQDEVRFDAGILFGSFDRLKLLQYKSDIDNGLLIAPTVDVPPGIGVSSLVSVPLIYQSELLGVLAIGNFSGGRLGKIKEEIFRQLAGILAGHIQSIKLILKLEKNNQELITLQQQLINSRNTLRTVFDNIPESLYIVDEDFTLIAINRSRANRVGLPIPQLVGNKCYQGLFNFASPCPGCQVTQTLSANSPKIRCMRYLQKDQSNLEWEIHSYPVSEMEENPRQVILLEQNITEKRKLEGELIQSEKLAAVGQLAAGIAHDINNPLTSIIANSQILLADIPAEETDLRHCAQLIEMAGSKATNVVRNLLSSVHKEDFSFEPIDLNESIQHSLLLLSHEYVSRDIKICFNRGEEMPLIFASDSHLQSVWTNLIMNSIESISNAPGKIDIFTQFDGVNFIVRIHDNGIGIPKEILGQIFEPFFTTKHTGEESGLGLTSVKRIIDAHNGQIMVESEVGVGTSFVIVLPKGQE